MNDKQSTKIDDEQLEELRDIFQSYDRNKDGCITQLELGSLLRSLGLNPRSDEVEAVIQKVDANNDGLVEFSDFMTIVAPELMLEEKSAYSEENLKLLFKVFDRDGNGYITAAELEHSMEKLGHAMTVEELTEMITEADTNGDGKISFEEFSHAITSASFDNSWG
ncbi:hypothetical protein like AT1G32250 [Hibiscus trionum]|uniref:EF-hand domain-containing protein n=1 Tax=Hibiscus trionum TaxID=183268 RepID=A0A9W7MH19_HIBTR|nr:hypothetical protein like AT1G32250 [Hibiscus trionum]